MTEFSLVPIDHQPEFEEFSFLPVGHDPFSADGTVQHALTQPESQPEPLAAGAGGRSGASF